MRHVALIAVLMLCGCSKPPELLPEPPVVTRRLQVAERHYTAVKRTWAGSSRPVYHTVLKAEGREFVVDGSWQLAREAHSYVVGTWLEVDFQGDYVIAMRPSKENQ